MTRRQQLVPTASLGTPESPRNSEGGPPVVAGRNALRTGPHTTRRLSSNHATASNSTRAVTTTPLQHGENCTDFTSQSHTDFVTTSQTSSTRYSVRVCLQRRSQAAAFTVIRGPV